MAEILRATAARYVAQYPGQAVPRVQGTLAKLSLCRTAALGGRRYRCDSCEHECVVHNSCGDRHCPQCAGARRADWCDSAGKLLLDGVAYFQVVFTLPSELSSLALGNRQAIYDLLFGSAWSSLRNTIEREQGFEPAALMVLHTWNQRLEAHGHVHALVPGGGPSLDRGGWVHSHRPNSSNPSSAPYLVDAVTLRRAYRDHFLAGLTRLRAQGELQWGGDFAPLQADEAWEEFLSKLRSTEWVSHIEPPPVRSDGQPSSVQHAVKYLARYLTGGPISDARIIAADEHEVTFWAREGQTIGGDRKQVPITLSTLEFTRRWCLHILPKGYAKTRRFGGWSNRRCETYVERCAILLEAIDAPFSSDDPLEFPPLDSEPEECTDTASVVECDVHPPCPKCGHALTLMDDIQRPSWRDLFASGSIPSWYRKKSFSPPSNLHRPAGSG